MRKIMSVIIILFCKITKELKNSNRNDIIEDNDFIIYKGFKYRTNNISNRS